jgi:hypothetical protein
MTAAAPTDHSILTQLMNDGTPGARQVMLDMLAEQIPGEDQAAFKSELEKGRVNLDRVIEHLAGRPTWKKRVTPSTLDTIRMRVERVNKAIRRKRGTEWTVVASPQIKECLNPTAPLDERTYLILHDVEVYGPPYPQVKPGYRLLGIISSAYDKGDVRDADGQILRVIPGGEDKEAEMTALVGDQLASGTSSSSPRIPRATSSASARTAPRATSPTSSRWKPCCASSTPYEDGAAWRARWNSATRAAGAPAPSSPWFSRSAAGSAGSSA